MTPGAAGVRTTTNATRVLDRLSVPYDVVEFAAVDFTAEEAAARLGVPAETVFKTLVLRGDRSGPLAAVIATPARLSTKKLARVSGNRTVTMVSVEEMERLTGYVKGGCSPFGMRKPIPVFADASVAAAGRMYCSAGRRGVQLVMAGADFLSASGAPGAPGITVADLVED